MRLHQVDTRNPKEIVIEGLRRKVEEMGELRVPFVFTMDNPSKETFARFKDGDEVAERRIVVRKPTNSVSHHAIGTIASSSVDILEAGGEINTYHGWVDNIDLEITVWSTASDDRDNIVNLIKIWMLELEQDDMDTGPFFYTHGIQAVRFISDRESENREIIQNGVMFLGTMVYNLTATFFNEAEPDELMKYKINLMGRVRDCIPVHVEG